MRSKLITADTAIFNEIEKIPLEDVHLFNSRLGSILRYNEKENMYYLESKYEAGMYNQFEPNMIKNIPYFISCTYVHEIHFNPNEATSEDVAEIIERCDNHYRETFLNDPILNAYFADALQLRAAYYQNNKAETAIHLNYFHGYRN